MKLPTHLLRSGLAVQSAAGLVDVGSASLASFAVGLFAARTLEPGALGAYALMFSALLFVTTIPAQLVFVPVMAESAKVGWELRGRYFLGGLRLGAWPVAVSGAALFAVWLLLPRELGPDGRTWLALSGAVAGLSHSVQLFSRQMLHYERRSWRAAAVSGVRLAVVVVSLFGLRLSGVPAIAVPLLGLAVGNFAGLAFALIGSGRSPKPLLSTVQVLQRGKFLVGTAALPTGAAFVASQLVVMLAGAEYLGFAEASRIVAQPILVLGMGLSAAMNPRIMEGAANGNTAVVRRVRRAFWVLGVTGAALYAVVVVPSWSVNVMERLVPVAYEIPGLVGISIFSAAIAALIMPLVTEMIGSNREKHLLRVDALASLVLIAVAATSPATRAFARPLATSSQGVAKLALLLQVTSRD